MDFQLLNFIPGTNLTYFVLFSYNMLLDLVGSNLFRLLIMETSVLLSIGACFLNLFSSAVDSVYNLATEFTAIALFPIL